MSENEDNIIQFNPSATFYFERAFDAYHKNDIEKGIKYFKRGISLASNIQEEYYGSVQLALMYQHGGEFQESYDMLKDLIEQSHQLQPDLYYFQAVNCSYLKIHSESKENLETFVELLDKHNIENNPYRDDAQEMLNIIDKLD